MRVFIAIPTAGQVHGLFAQSLANMIARTLGERPGLKIVTQVEIGKLPMVRNRLLKSGIESGAEYMLWLDSDHVFPDWSLLRLLLVDREVVGIAQPTRTRPFLSTARDPGNNRMHGGRKAAQAGLVEEAGTIGFAMVLTKMSIVDKLKAQAAKEGRASIYPMFAFTMTDDPDVAGGEDSFFCMKLREAGIGVHVDHQLSWATWHMAEIPVGMSEVAQDAIQRRA